MNRQQRNSDEPPCPRCLIQLFDSNGHPSRRPPSASSCATRRPNSGSNITSAPEWCNGEPLDDDVFRSPTKAPRWRLPSSPETSTTQRLSSGYRAGCAYCMPSQATNRSSHREVQSQPRHDCFEHRCTPMRHWNSLGSISSPINRATSPPWADRPKRHSIASTITENRHQCACSAGSSSGPLPAYERCGHCGRLVYFNERVSSLSVPWHLSCLQCIACGKRLSPGRHAVSRGLPICQYPCMGTFMSPYQYAAGSKDARP